MVQVAASLPIVAEEKASERGFVFDSTKPTSETLALQDSITAKSVRSVSKGPVTVTLENVLTFENLAALSGPDSGVIGHVFADLVVENASRSSIAYVKLDVLVMIEGFRVSDEQITVMNLGPGEKVSMRSPATVYAGDVPQKMKESYAAMIKSGATPEFSAHLANLDVAGY